MVARVKKFCVFVHYDLRFQLFMIAFASRPLIGCVPPMPRSSAKTVTSSCDPQLQQVNTTITACTAQSSSHTKAIFTKYVGLLHSMSWLFIVCWDHPPLSLYVCTVSHFSTLPCNVVVDLVLDKSSNGSRVVFLGSEQFTAVLRILCTCPFFGTGPSACLGQARSRDML